MVENKKTLIERMRARLEDRKIENEKGLALLDVLIGMAIFALIAVIAVSAISQYRARAYESGAVSDARQAGIAMEAAFTDGNGYPTSQTELEAQGVKFTNGNTAQVNSAGETFTLCVEHTSSGAFAVYDSADGGVTQKGRSGGCASVTGFAG